MTHLLARRPLWKIALTGSMFLVRVLNSIERYLLGSAAPTEILDDFPVRTRVARRHQNSETSQTQSNRLDQSRREARVE
jgi:hypothetical protein